MKLSIMLWGIPQAMRVAARVYPEYAARLKERNLIAQFRLRDKPEGRWIKLENGRISSRKGIHAKPDLTIHLQEQGHRGKLPDAALRPAGAHRRREEFQDRPGRSGRPGRLVHGHPGPPGIA